MIPGTDMTIWMQDGEMWASNEILTMCTDGMESLHIWPEFRNIPIILEKGEI